MNFLFAVIVLTFVVMFGIFYYKKTIKKYIFYQNFKSFCDSLETEIGFFQNKIFQIIKKQNYSENFSKVLDSFKNNNLEECLKSLSFLSAQEKDEIKNFFNKLGRTSSKTQILEINNFKQFLALKIDEQKNVELKKSKLKFNLIILFGILLFILIL